MHSFRQCTKHSMIFFRQPEIPKAKPSHGHHCILGKPPHPKSWRTGDSMWFAAPRPPSRWPTIWSRLGYGTQTLHGSNHNETNSVQFIALVICKHMNKYIIIYYIYKEKAICIYIYTIWVNGNPLWHPTNPRQMRFSPVLYIGTYLLLL